MVQFLKASGYDPESIKETIIVPIWEWAFYTVAPRAVREDDPEARYLVDSVATLRQRLDSELQ